MTIVFYSNPPPIDLHIPLPSPHWRIMTKHSNNRLIILDLFPPATEERPEQQQNVRN